MSREVVTEYFNKYVGVVSSGRIEADGFKEIFNLAFPSRPLDKLDLLTKELVDEETQLLLDSCWFFCTCSPTPNAPITSPRCSNSSMPTTANSFASTSSGNSWLTLSS